MRTVQVDVKPVAYFIRLYSNGVDERIGTDIKMINGISRPHRSNWVLLEVPFPVFDVTASVSLLSSWKGFGGSKVCRVFSNILISADLPF